MWGNGFKITNPVTRHMRRNVNQLNSGIDPSFHMAFPHAQHYNAFREEPFNTCVLEMSIR
jgi:hypothetical protein